MKLQIFQSANGDCLLLESNDGKRILCDGGMARSMRELVRQHLAKLRTQNKRLDVVYVSHIDQDHISGVLQLLQDELAWRVFDHHTNAGDTGVKKPKVPRPPEIGCIWHNAFRDMISKNKGDIEKLLAAAAPVLLGAGIRELVDIGQTMHDISLSVPEALKVSRLASKDLLKIPVNKLPGSNDAPLLLFMRDELTSFDIGSMTLTTIGPTEHGLRQLRKGWDEWLRNNKETVQKIRAEMRRRIDEFSNGALAGTPFDLREWNGVPDFKGVSAPNIASLMFMVEEGNKRLLLTGDSQQDVILECLKGAGLLDSGSLHLDVLKVQHHGSENNLDAKFCKQVSARHYVFCGNGAHGNPEQKVIRTIFESRLGAPQNRTLAPEAANENFTFWFSTRSTQEPGGEARDNFEAVEHLVDGLVAQSNGRLTAKYNDGDFITLNI